MPLPLYDDFHHAIEVMEKADWQVHCEYLANRGFTGVVLTFAQPFTGQSTTLEQSGVSGNQPTTSTAGTAFTFNATYANFVRELVDIAGAEGLRVALITLGEFGWTNLNNTGNLRVENSYNAGVSFATYFGDSPDIEFWIHGWDSSRNPDGTNQLATIWANVSQGIRDGVGEATAKQHTYHCSVGNGVNQAQKFKNASWLDFHFIQTGHNTGFVNDPNWWNTTKNLLNTGKDIWLGEAWYAHVWEDTQSVPTAAQMGQEAANAIAFAAPRLSGISYGDWYRVTWCDPGEGAKFDNAIADGKNDGMKTTRKYGGNTFGGATNIIGNEGELAYLEAMGILAPSQIPDWTVDNLDTLQTIINNGSDGDLIEFNDGIYDADVVSIAVPLAQVRTMRPIGGVTRWWGTDPALGAGSFSGRGVLLTGGRTVGSFVSQGGGNYKASWSGPNIGQASNSDPDKQYFTEVRDGHYLTCTSDGTWLHHVAGTGNLQDTPRQGAAGNYWFDYGAQELWVSFNPVGKTIILSELSNFIGGPGTLNLAGVSISGSRIQEQQGMVQSSGPNWDLDRLEVFGAHGLLVALKDNNGVLRNSYLHHAGQMNFGASPAWSVTIDGAFNGVNNSLRNTLLEYGNMNFYKPGWEAGITKSVFQDGFVYEHNLARFAYGFGLWSDINNYDITWLFNHVHDIWGVGIVQEISFRFLIEFNKAERCGAWPNRNVGTFPDQALFGFGWDSMPGIVVAETNSLFDRLVSAGGGPGGRSFIRNNICDDCRGGILLRQVFRDQNDLWWPGSDSYHLRGIHSLKNDVWWDPTAWTTAERHGAADSHDSQSVPPGGSRTDTLDIFDPAHDLFFNDTDFTINGREAEPSGTYHWDGDLPNIAAWRAVGFDSGSAGADASPEVYGLVAGNPLIDAAAGPRKTHTTDAVLITTGGSVPPSAFGFYTFDGNTANFFSSPDSPLLSVPNHVDARCLVRAKDWTPVLLEVLIGKFKYDTNQASYRLVIANDPLNFWIQASYDGNPANAVVTSRAASFVDDEDWVWIRGILRPSSGSGEILWKGIDDVDWTSLGATSFGPQSGIFDGSGDVEIGRVGGVADNALNGDVAAIEIWDGVEGEGGTLASSLDFRTDEQRTSEAPDVWTDPEGNVWTEQGSVVYSPGGAVFTRHYHTDAILRDTFAKPHTTDALKSLAAQFVTHTTDALVAVISGVETHTTDALLISEGSPFHTTDVIKAVLSQTLTHTSDAIKSGVVEASIHTADSIVEQVVYARPASTTSAGDWEGFPLATLSDNIDEASPDDSDYIWVTIPGVIKVVAHLTDAIKAFLAQTLTHTTDAIKAFLALTKDHTTDAHIVIGGQSLTHTADAIILAEVTKTHTTDAHKVNRITATHTTDAEVDVIEEAGSFSTAFGPSFEVREEGFDSGFSDGFG